MIFENINLAKITFENKFDADFSEYEKLAKQYETRFIKVSIYGHSITLEVDFEDVLGRPLTRVEKRELDSENKKSYLIIDGIPCFRKQREKNKQYDKLNHILDNEYNLEDEVFYGLLNDFKNNIKTYDDCINIAIQNHKEL